MPTSKVGEFEFNDHSDLMVLAMFHTNCHNLYIGIVQVADCKLPKGDPIDPVRIFLLGEG
jgi:hypothetical protein